MDRITFSATAALEGRTLTGVVHSYGSLTLRNGSYIEFQKGAFDKALEKSDVRAFWNHDTTLLLGRQSNGTVRLESKDDGLHYGIDLPDTSYAQDMQALIDRGDLNEMSFGIEAGKTSYRRVGTKRVELHTEVKEIFDISPVSLPAFQGTSIRLHSLTLDGETIKSQLVKARARVLANKE